VPALVAGFFMRGRMRWNAGKVEEGFLETPDSIPCDVCGSIATVFMIQGYVLGQETLWPKSTMRGNALYFFIECPNCGERY
jgi:hypothetical protein